MSAPSLDAAIALQNEVDYGLTAGLHSLDQAEINRWLDQVEAGNLYVNRGITGAIVARQPFGGWKKSAVGPGTKAGGPSYLLGLCEWTSTRSLSRAEIKHEAATHILLAAETIGLDPEECEFLKRSLQSDAQAWSEEYGVARDVSALGVELNILRYRPVPVVVRASKESSTAHLLRVVAAGLLAGSPLIVSSAVGLDHRVIDLLRELAVTVERQGEQAWLDSLASDKHDRIRLMGPAPAALFHRTQERVELTAYTQPVTESGRLELLPFLREQAISITAHRFGTPSPTVGFGRS